jgi:hypothetical protein
MTKVINVIVASKKDGIIEASAPVTLKPIPTINSGVDRLDNLKDVNATAEINGATLVYDIANDTYNVKKLDLADVVGALDGGNY